MKSLHEGSAWKVLGQAALLLIILMICKYVSDTYFQLMLIRGNSMEPTYHTMQFVVLDKRDHTYRSGDVVAFRCKDLHAVLVKRVVAGPGQSVVIRGGKLLVDDKEPALYERAVFSYDGILSEPIALSSGEYIVIGDNIEESKDSRYEQVGIIQEKDIIGIVN